MANNDIKKLIQSPQYEAVIKFAAKIIDEWKDSPVVTDSEYQTLRLTIQRESKVEALKEFLDKLEKAGQD